MAIKIIKRPAATLVPEPLVPVAKVAPVEKFIGLKQGVLDGECQVVLDRSPQAAVAWYLMASYLYYVHDLALLSDPFYDRLAKSILTDWDQITHPHKALLSKDDLKAGTLFRLSPAAYPLLTRNAARHMVKGSWGIDIIVDHEA